MRTTGAFQVVQQGLLTGALALRLSAAGSHARGMLCCVTLVDGRALSTLARCSGGRAPAAHACLFGCRTARATALKAVHQHCIGCAGAPSQVAGDPKASGIVCTCIASCASCSRAAAGGSLHMHMGIQSHLGAACCWGAAERSGGLPCGARAWQELLGSCPGAGSSWASSTQVAEMCSSAAPRPVHLPPELRVQMLPCRCVPPVVRCCAALAKVASMLHGRCSAHMYILLIEMA